MEAMGREAIQEVVNKVSWKASNYKSLHEYVLVWNEPELYTSVKALIEREGYFAKWRGRKGKYVDIGPHRYWIIQHVLNRADVNDPEVVR